MAKSWTVREMLERADYYEARAKTLRGAAAVMRDEDDAETVVAVAPVAAASETQEDGRKSQLIAFLKENGPANRKEMLEGLNMPEGTISYLLSTNRDVLEKTEDRKWKLKNS